MINHVINCYTDTKKWLHLTTTCEFSTVDSKWVSSTVLLLHNDIITTVRAFTLQVKWCAIVAHCHLNTTANLSSWCNLRLGSSLKQSPTLILCNFILHSPYIIHFYTVTYSLLQSSFPEDWSIFMTCTFCTVPHLTVIITVMGPS